MAREAGEENPFLFGLTDDPHWHYEQDAETRAALDLIRTNHFSPDEPGLFAPLLDALLVHGDHYMHLADLPAYLEAVTRLTLCTPIPRPGRRRQF